MGRDRRPGACGVAASGHDLIVLYGGFDSMATPRHLGVDDLLVSVDRC